MKQFDLLIKNILTVSFSVLILTTFSLAQPSSYNRKKNPYSWMFGISWNVVNDNEEKLPNLYDVSGSWNSLYYPSRITIDKYLRRGWSLEGSIAYSQYKSTKIINDSTGRSGIFLSGDFHLKYSYNHLIKRKKWFDPYYSFGLGFTYRSALEAPFTPTANLAIGSNFWFSRSFGIQTQVLGKLALVSDIYKSRYDYFNYSLGIVYRKQNFKKTNHFNKKKYGWTHEKQRFKRRNT
jgi:hypothetical protein